MSSGSERTPSPILVNIATVVLWAILLGTLPFGITVIHWGLDNLNRDQPYCNGIAMSRGDTCVNHGVRASQWETNYDGQLAQEHMGAKVQIVVGVVLSVIGAGLLFLVVISRLGIWPKRKLDELLVTPAQAAVLLGVSGMELSASSDILLDDSACLADRDCLAAFTPAQLSAYGHCGWTGMRIHTLTENAGGRPGTTAAQIIEAVIDFPSAEAAASMQRAQAQLWAAAVGRSVTYRHGEQLSSWVFGPLSNTGEMLTIRRTQEDGGGWTAQRALTVRGTVVVDVQVSGFWSGNDQARQLLEVIVATVSSG
ncbi:MULTISPECIES: sensor domain-containing protein [unclassified Mycobacterium]|uniref:sensor domain-containing protein n=1 Tax=unclassified Mycobacterium TaxID=2642494 RepID=UPI000992F36F|nr:MULTISPECIES: sensor domain-containing protein [unclassified Mycobacterium]